MAKVNGIFSTKLQGKVGSVVYRVRKGTNIVSEKPSSVANPRTSGQQYNRMVMRTVAAAYSSLKEICDHSFEGISKGSSSQALFMRENIRLMQGKSHNFNLRRNTWMIPNNYLLSKGSLENIPLSKPQALHQEAGKDNLNGSGNNISYMGVYFGLSGIGKAIETSIAENPDSKSEIKEKYILNALGIKQGQQLTFVTNYVPKNYLLVSNADVTQPTTKTAFARIIFKEEAEGTGKVALEACAWDAQNNPTAFEFKAERLTEESVGFEHLRIVKCTSAEEQFGSYWNLMYVPDDIEMDYYAKEGIYVGGAAVILSEKNGNTWKRSTTYLVPFDGSEEYMMMYVVSSYNPSDPYYLNNALPDIKVGNI